MASIFLKKVVLLFFYIELEKSSKKIALTINKKNSGQKKVLNKNAIKRKSLAVFRGGRINRN